MFPPSGAQTISIASTPDHLSWNAKRKQSYRLKSRCTFDWKTLGTLVRWRHVREVIREVTKKGEGTYSRTLNDSFLNDTKRKK